MPRVVKGQSGRHIGCQTGVVAWWSFVVLEHVHESLRHDRRVEQASCRTRMWARDATLTNWEAESSAFLARRRGRFRVGPRVELRMPRLVHLRRLAASDRWLAIRSPVGLGRGGPPSRFALWWTTSACWWRELAWLANRSSRTVQASGGWYRYGDSNPGPVAENHVS